MRSAGRLAGGQSSSNLRRAASHGVPSRYVWRKLVGHELRPAERTCQHVLNPTAIGKIQHLPDGTVAEGVAAGRQGSERHLLAQGAGDGAHEPADGRV